jgi:hypothetical protein
LFSLKTKTFQIVHKDLSTVGGVQTYMESVDATLGVHSLFIDTFYKKLFTFFRSIGSVVIIHKPCLIIYCLFAKRIFLVIHDQPTRYFNVFSGWLKLIKYFSNIRLVCYTPYDKSEWENMGYVVEEPCYNPLKDENFIFYNSNSKVSKFLFYGRLLEEQKRISRLKSIPPYDIVLYGSLGKGSEILLDSNYDYKGIAHGLDQVLSENPGYNFCAILCSDHEGLPLSIFEFLSRGIPVVSTPSSPGIKWLSENVGGIKLVDFDFVYEDLIRARSSIELTDFRSDVLNYNKKWRDQWLNILNIDLPNC